MAEEMFGNIEDIFFKTDNGTSVFETQSSEPEQKLEDISAKMASLQQETNTHKKLGKTGNGNTIIQLSKEFTGSDEDKEFILSEQEEYRFNTRLLKGSVFININSGSMVVVKDSVKLYDNSILYQVEQPDGNIITYPRSKFTGREKEFVPAKYYMREIERNIEDKIDEHKINIYKLLEEFTELTPTSDEKYLELILEEPIPLPGFIIPDKQSFNIVRLFDMHYKLMQLEMVIIVDNAIAGLLFNDMWF